VRADPANYRSELLGGFVNAYLWLIKYSDEVSDILNKWVQDDFRIRYLVRKTRLYATVMHMLNLPMSWSYEAWRDHIFSQLRRSGHFPQTLSEQTIQAECHDLENRDIPHFWLVAGEPVIQHATGRCQGISWKRPVLAQARLDVKRLCRSDLTLQTDILMNFLDKNLDGSINPNGQ
jgi:lantibiotic modifying enzyme